MSDPYALETPSWRSPTVVSRTYRTTPAELWSLWTTREGFEAWWGPQGFRGDVHAIDARADGVLRYDMVAATPDMIAAMVELGQPTSHGVQARFATFEPQERLALASVIDFLPGVAPYESLISVEFEPQGDRTHMRVSFTPMHDAETTEMQIEGFTSQLSKLDARFASEPDQPSAS